MRRCPFAKQRWQYRSDAQSLTHIVTLARSLERELEALHRRCGPLTQERLARNPAFALDLYTLATAARALAGEIETKIPDDA